MKFTSIIVITAALVSQTESAFLLRGGRDHNIYVDRVKELGDFQYLSDNEMGQNILNKENLSVLNTDSSPTKFDILPTPLNTGRKSIFERISDFRKRRRSPSLTSPDDRLNKMPKKSPSKSDGISSGNSSFSSLSSKNSSSFSKDSSDDDTLTLETDSVSSFSDLSEENGFDFHVDEIFDLEVLAAPIKWDNVPINSEINLTDNQGEIIFDYANKDSSVDIVDFPEYEQDFNTKVLKTLGFICDKYPINDFVVNLASALVYLYDVKAPNAIRYFMDSFMSFMADPKWKDSDLFERVNQKLRLSLPKVYDDSLANDKIFQLHVYNLFLNVAPNKSLLNALMKLYTEAFSQVSTFRDFIECYSSIISVLIELAEEKKSAINTRTFLSYFRNKKTELSYGEVDFVLKNDMAEFITRVIRILRNQN